MAAYAWAVEYGDGLRAVFIDEARAMDFAVRAHGIVVPLYDMRGRA